MASGGGRQQGMASGHHIKGFWFQEFRFPWKAGSFTSWEGFEIKHQKLL